MGKSKATTPQNKEPVKGTTKPEAQHSTQRQQPKNASASTGRRLSDLVFVLTYLGWVNLVFVIFFTRCRHLLPDTLPNGEQFATPVCEALQALEGPLAPLLETHTKWGDKMFNVADDFTLRFVHCVNIMFLGPVALVLAVGFLLGKPFTKNVALISAPIMLYNMALVDVYVYKYLHGATAPKDEVELATSKLMASIIYGYFTIFPIVVIKRVWAKEPFAVESTVAGFTFGGFVSFVFKFVFYVWMFATVIGFYEFSVKHTPSLKHAPSVVDGVVEGWEQTAPHRAEMMIRAAEFQVYASEQMKIIAARTKEFVEKVGEDVLEWARKMREGKEEGAPPAKEEAKPAKKQPKKKNPEP